jgi:hypothetical protein
VPAKLGDKGEPVDLLFGGVVKDMNLDEAEEELPDHFIAPRHRCTTRKIGSENAGCTCLLTTRVLYRVAISTFDISLEIKDHDDFGEQFANEEHRPDKMDS